MSYPAYPDYKPSGVDWLGDVPTHWEVRRLKYVAQLRNEKNEADEENQLPYIGLEHIESWTGKLLPLDTETVPVGISNRFRSGAILFGKLRPYLAKACRVDFEGLCTSELLVLEANSQHAQFLLYQLLSEGFVSLIDSSTYGAKMPRASWDFIGYCELPIPPVSEQRAIADFLDAQTARLDTLIAKKRELIDKLNEKRSALISRTVTRGLPPAAARAAGLDPHPRLKPSGIEWLGEIPEHWEVKAIKHIAKVGNGSTPSRENSDYWWDGSYPWLNSSVVNQEQVTEAEEFVTDLALRECHLPRIKPPAVLIGITGQGRTRGMATTLLFEATINQHLAYLKPHPSICDVRYLRRMLDSAYSYLRNESDGSGSTKGAITCEQISNVTISLPPLREQRSIADYLDQETARIDQMVGAVEAAIERLLEYRTALITAAVTGKIDVRGHAA